LTAGNSTHMTMVRALFARSETWARRSEYLAGAGFLVTARCRRGVHRHEGGACHGARPRRTPDGASAAALKDFDFYETTRPSREGALLLSRPGPIGFLPRQARLPGALGTIDRSKIREGRQSCDRPSFARPEPALSPRATISMHPGPKRRMISICTAGRQVLSRPLSSVLTVSMNTRYPLGPHVG